MTRYKSDTVDILSNARDYVSDAYSMINLLLQTELETLPRDVRAGIEQMHDTLSCLRQTAKDVWNDLPEHMLEMEE
ncbi:hypothetical protein ELI15_14100 [Rhizobium ruizarguesonis]|uniref:hypothetical protein n=1 Tax=Rhizobium ruizarguesonis TaxID=2081791 RepID=UPI00102FA5D2|nr:hypothetical protein [Rhizobium ruizarguesonis]TAW65422.1 hypothetical protein ELI15_14100 [Rhizobium ruizarguesonis]